MIKRVSLVWKKADISADQFRALWLGEHAELAKRLGRLREYVIDFVEAPAPGVPDGIATLRFDSVDDLQAAFADDPLREALMRTRDAFADRVEVFLVDERRVFASGGS